MDAAYISPGHIRRLRRQAGEGRYVHGCSSMAVEKSEKQKAPLAVIPKTRRLVITATAAVENSHHYGRDGAQGHRGVIVGRELLPRFGQAGVGEQPGAN